MRSPSCATRSSSQPALVEQPNGDFASTIARQCLSTLAVSLRRPQRLTDARLAAIAAKALKETQYHARFSSGWLVRLGDGTPESRRAYAGCRGWLWRFTDELFAEDAVDVQMTRAGIAPALASQRTGGHGAWARTWARQH